MTTQPEMALSPRETLHRLRRALHAAENLRHAVLSLRQSYPEEAARIIAANLPGKLDGLIEQLKAEILRTAKHKGE